MRSELTPYERWMVKSNLRRIQDGEFTASDLVQLLRSRGYDRVASALEKKASEAITERKDTEQHIDF